MGATVSGLLLIGFILWFAYSLSGDGQAEAETEDPGWSDPFMWDEKTRALAVAIATAEGFFASGNPLPARLNNPGDLKSRDADGNLVLTNYATVEEGWEALYRQCWLMISGRSRYYNPSMTFLQIAAPYTGNDNAAAWARNVASVLGMQADNTLDDFLRMA
jgi:hypothetical protein